MAVAVVASSCQKDLGGSPDSPVVPGAVPADFDWKTTRNVTVSVSAPVVEGATPPYAVIRIYSSPILSAENLAARGVAKSAMPFRSAFTLPAGTENLYVQTTLPDGTKSVKMVGAHGTVAVTGASMKAAAAPKMRLAANARIGSSMPDYPKMEAPDAASFDSKAVITAIESGKSYQLGASWAFYAAPEYLIPAGAEVAGELDLNGGFSPYQAPILYVAGKLTLSSLNIGRAKLAVLPGGEVKIGTLKIQPSAADGAAVYVFADGKLSVGKPNVSGKCIVNNGTLTVDGSLDMNSGLTVYNTATAVLNVTDEMKVSNSARIYNDGAVTVDDLKINSDGEFHNCENALLVVNDECELERNTAIYQRGRASIEEMTARGTIWVNCHTSVNELEAQGAEFNFSANAGLDAGRVEFNNTNVSMARGAIFTMEEYNADEKGGGNRFTFTGDADPRAVVLISEKAYTRKGHETYFSGAIEVVYDNDRDEDYTIRKDYLTDGAVMSASQTTIITENGCNGGKDPVNPDPEPEPSNLISFETNEGMLAIDGKAVQLGDITVSGGSAAGNNHNVFWAKGGSYDDLAVGGVYNGYLCSTSDEKIWFGTYFSADIGYGDYWGGFVLSANYGRTATSVNYANQFMVWADKGANGSSNCMIGYFDGYTSGYATPMIEFVEPRQVSYLYMANSAITYPYKPTQVDEASYYYKVKITGSLEGKETGSAECFLINGSEKLSDWKKVDLSALGKVDCLTFSPASNEANAYGLLVPAYFAIDEIGLIAEK